MIGVGNRARGDDACGLAVLDRLSAEPPGDLFQAGSDPLSFLERLRGREHVIVVDAMRSGAPVGSVVRVDLSRALGDESASLVSSHAVGLAEALELARVLGLWPARLTLLAIEAGETALGASLTPQARAGVERAAAMIREECACTKPR